MDIETMRKEAHIVSENMKQYGGAFVVALSQCIVYADDENLRKIHDAFPEYWNKYLEVVPISGKITY